MQTLKISTFNCENLFSRPKMLNLSSATRTTELLTKTARLKEILEKESYSPSDKQEIFTLENELKDYLVIAEDVGRLFSGTKEKRRVSAAGASDWSGRLELKRAEINDVQRKATARVLKEVGADVQCLIEVEDRLTVHAFNSQRLNHAFAYNMVIDGNDTRGIDVGLYSKYPIANIKTHIFDKNDNDDRIFSRDCLEIELTVPFGGGRSLHVLVNHFKSKGYGDQAESDEKRLKQATRVRDIISESYDLDKDWVIVAGDLNDRPGSEPLRPLLTKPGLHDVLELKFGSNVDERWTYYYRAREQIDYLLVSAALREFFDSAGVERRGMPNISKRSVSGNETPFPEVTKAALAASDHGAVWATFKMEE